MKTDHRDRARNESRRPPADRWTRESFTFRRMTWGNIWLLTAALMIGIAVLGSWMMS